MDTEAGMGSLAVKRLSPCATLDLSLGSLYIHLCIRVVIKCMKMLLSPSMCAEPSPVPFLLQPALLVVMYS